ncbi:MAG: F-type H+-transporting ATPase subunit c [Parcubacteria group bacterium Gr01-1014_18]|nr:MAG: F-type H+-transporting ATPase subunit c [Parcubacteria group bacterium Greene0416_36]TSC80857.1 MAG: F-type H+-transporting ATPase subunit c [Parcubacteria group bacterium Gr01-1014_18]TSC99518.1 MAG: F-type H+-transporting ATPase subunit c [Parcubacteria group bacterium Greene1014_20]TSD07563.1 MAG: F-type H+-transporting ATPase subunit c [Parcubacteria group bacterium Greene0714_2]
MEAESMKFLAIAIIMAGSAIGPAIGIGMIGAKTNEALGRNPEAAAKLQTNMILAIAFTEALAIYGLVMALILKFV